MRHVASVCRRAAGFTLIELIVLLAIIGIASLIGMPALLNSIHRARFEGAVREAKTVLLAARLDAIRFSTDTYVQADFVDDRLVSYREANNTPGLQVGAGGDEELRSFALPPRVYFWSPTDGAAEGATAVTFPGSLLQYGSTGSAEDLGALRFSDGRGNFLEINLEPEATARLEMRKWDGTDWKGQGEGGVSWNWN